MAHAYKDQFVLARRGLDVMGRIHVHSLYINGRAIMVFDYTDGAMFPGDQTGGICKPSSFLSGAVVRAVDEAIINAMRYAKEGK